MKSLKKVLSVVLALLMLCSCIAVSSISASAITMDELDSEKYDDNILFTGDEFIRDYSYATYLTDNWPRQLSFNEDGWMKIQSQTAEEIAAGEPGTYDKQWSISFIPTPEYQTQFKNGVKYALEEGNDLTYHYFYAASAQLKGSKGTQDSIDCSLSYTIGCDLDGDGDYSDYKVVLGSQKNFTTKHPLYDYQYQNLAFALAELREIIESEADFKLTGIVFQPRNYDSEGVGMLELYISPLYVNKVPGTDVNPMNTSALAELDIRKYLAGTKFTSGKLDKDGDGDLLNDWQWKTWEKAPDDDHPPIYGAEEYGSKGDIVRDPETRCPVMADGTVYNPIPIVQLVKEGDVEVADLAAAVDGTNATLTWKNNGSTASKYEITYKKDGTVVGRVEAKTESYTFTGLEAGAYEATVTGFNVEGKRSRGVKVSFTVAASSTPEQPSTQPTQPTQPTEPSTQPTQPTEPSTQPSTACVHATTKLVGAKAATCFAAGFSGNKVCVLCGQTVLAGKTIAKIKLAKPTITTKLAGKKIKVGYKKVAGANKIQIRYRIKGKWIIKEYKATKNVTKTLKNLKKGKYKVQVRALCVSGKQKAYSKWSKVSKVTVK